MVLSAVYNNIHQGYYGSLKSFCDYATKDGLSVLRSNTKSMHVTTWTVEISKATWPADTERTYTSSASEEERENTNT